MLSKIANIFQVEEQHVMCGLIESIACLMWAVQSDCQFGQGLTARLKKDKNPPGHFWIHSACSFIFFNNLFGHMPKPNGFESSEAQ